MRWVDKWLITSPSSGKEYVVSLAEDGETYGCSCPHWIYRRGTCKHIRMVRDNIADNIDRIYMGSFDNHAPEHDEFFQEEEFAL